MTKIVVGSPQGKVSVGRGERRWKNYIKTRQDTVPISASPTAVWSTPVLLRKAISSSNPLSSARNGNLKVPLDCLRAKQGYIVRKIEKDKWLYYILVSAGMKFRNKKKFRYGIPVHFQHCLYLTLFCLCIFIYYIASDKLYPCIIYRGKPFPCILSYSGQKCTLVFYTGQSCILAFYLHVQKLFDVMFHICARTLKDEGKLRHGYVLWVYFPISQVIVI
jgi:hypothetical protein